MTSTELSDYQLGTEISICGIMWFHELYDIRIKQFTFEHSMTDMTLGV